MTTSVPVSPGAGPSGAGSAGAGSPGPGRRSRLASLRERARPATASGFARSAGALLVGHVGRAVLQGVYFLVVARSLRAQGFGEFSAVLAVGALVAPFASLGAVHLLIRSAVRSPAALARTYAGAVVVTTVGGAAATVAATWGAVAYLPGLSAPVAAALLVADLVGSLLAEVAAGVQTARARSGRAAAVQLGFHGTRLVGALVLLVAPFAFSLPAWALTYAGTSLAAAAVCVALVARDVGRARPDVRGLLGQWRDGLLFSVGLASQAMYNDIDKTMLARLSTLSATGAYTAAYRVVDMALTPLRAVLAAAYPRFFAAGADGLGPSLRLVRRLAPATVGYCALAAGGLLAGAGLLPVLLGPSYAGSVGALRGLAVLPLLKVAHYLAADALTGAGHQGLRSGFQVGIALGNVALNLALIPAHGLAGAVVASLVCDGALAVVLWVVVLVLHRRLRVP